MRKKTNKLMSLLLTLCMVVGLASGLGISAAADGAVCVVGTTEYTSISDAITAATGPVTIRLIADVETNVSVATDKDITLDLNDHILSGVYDYPVIINNGTLTITDSAESKTTRYWTKDSSGLWTLAEDQNTATDYTTVGGVITGGKGLSSNAGRLGGGVLNNGTFAMAGGNIVGNTASYSGGGVYTKGAFIMAGGCITGNTAGSVAGGVYYWKMEGATITLKGQITIKDNTVNGSASNLVLSNKGTAELNGLSADSAIGVTFMDEDDALTTGKFAYRVQQSEAACFTGDNRGYSIVFDEFGYLYMKQLNAGTITTPETVTGGEIAISPDPVYPGETVTITVTPDEGYELDTLTATYGSDNTEYPLTDNQDGTYSFTMPNIALNIAVSFKETEPAPTFADVASGAWYADSVAWAVKNNVTTGTTKTTFSPSKDCTRAMLVTFLWRAAGEPEPNTENCPFTDVKADSYYEKAVLWAVEKDITNGTGETTFSPDDPVTREQVATMLYRYTKSLGGGYTDQWAFLLTFDDANEIDGWANEAMHWCVQEGIIHGVGDNKLAPTATATRAEIVTMLYRHFGK